MGLLFRSGILFSMALLALPVGIVGPADEASVGPIQAVFAAKEAVTDLTGLCERKPDVCATGFAAASTITARAQESARMAMEMIERRKTSAGDAKTIPATIDRQLKTGAIIPIPTPRATVVDR